MSRFAIVAATVALVGCADDANDDRSSASTTAVATAGTEPGVAAEGRSVDIGDGRTLYLECAGSGEPTIILESGIHDASDYWSVSQLIPPAANPPVMQGLATTNRVCRYDRPGTVVTTEPASITTRSSPVPMPRTIADSVDDLHRLLAAADVSGPYLLVAHSWGGMIGQLYTRTYPADVVGLVLVDAFAPDLRELLGDKWDAYTKVLNDPPGADALSSDPRYEKFDVEASVDEISAAPPLPTGLPFVVLSKTEAFPDLGPDAGMATADLDAVWPQAQQSLVDLLPNTPHMIASGSIHYIQVTEPDLVIAATRLALARAAAIPGG